MNSGDLVIIKKNKDTCNYEYAIILKTTKTNDKTMVLILKKYSTRYVDSAPNDCISPLSDKQLFIKEINEYYNKKIEAEQLKLMSVRASDYQEGVIDKYQQLKNEINNTARHMIDSSDDVDFENKLKAICRKKQELFTIECIEVKEARKYNGIIKHNIRDIEKEKQTRLQILQDDDFIYNTMGEYYSKDNN